MTTIATDGLSIACDGLMTIYDRVADTNRQKIFELRDGSFVGVCGEIAGVEDFIAWLEDPSQTKPERSFEIAALLIGRSEQGFAQFINGSCDTLEVPVPAAIGSGEAFAIAAMKMGASPRRAVEVACELDIHSGGTIREYTIDGAHSSAF